MAEMLQVLTLSTAHITPDVAAELDAGETSAWRKLILCAPWFGYGWWIWVPEDTATWDEVPSCLSAIFRVAHGLGATFVKLDQDAETVVGMPVYDW